VLGACTAADLLLNMPSDLKVTIVVLEESNERMNVQYNSLSDLDEYPTARHSIPATEANQKRIEFMESELYRIMCVMWKKRGDKRSLFEILRSLDIIEYHGDRVCL
jgi:hypothetical protein